MSVAADPRRALRLASVAVGAVWLPVFLLWDPILHTVTVDDAFYYFTIGRNIAEGDGSTFDGMHTTNGYHPLWMVACVAVFLVGLDDTAAVLTLLVLQLGLWCGALFVLGDVIADLVGGWPAFRGRSHQHEESRRGSIALGSLWFLVGANPYVLKLFVNGMETGLAALLGALLLAHAVRHKGDLLVRPAATTVLLAVLFLARTDAALIIGCAVVAAALRVRVVDRRVLAVGAGMGAVVLVYLASNLALVGHPMQISGVTKRVDPDLGRWVTLVVCAAAAVACLVLGRRQSGDSSSRFPRCRRWFAATSWWPAGSFLLLAYDWGLSSEIYIWHYAPHALWVLTTLAVAIADIYEGGTLERADTHPAVVSRSRVLATIMMLPFVAGGTITFGKALDPELRTMSLGDRAAARWMSDNLPADAVVASGDAGVIGYFTDRPVVNLDGLVNSFDWYDARHEGTAATRRFLLRAGVTHIANHGDLVDGDDPSLRRVVDGLFGDGAGQAMQLVHRETYIVSGAAGGISGRRPYATSVFELDLT